jgi:hypothetical protein
MLTGITALELLHSAKRKLALGYQHDGIRIKAGKSWLSPFVEFDGSAEKQ